MFLDIIHLPVLSKTPSCFYSKHSVWETRFCLHLQVKHAQLDPLDRANPEIGDSSINWTKLSRYSRSVLAISAGNYRK
jgi:hypothetical protein